MRARAAGGWRFFMPVTLKGAIDAERIDRLVGEVLAGRPRMAHACEAIGTYPSRGAAGR
jgi:hypothetical protein